MLPFTFSNPSADWARFSTAANAWKPDGYDREMDRRLAYYLDDQEEELRAELKKRFPETHQTMTPVTVPLTRLLTQEQAKVFLSTTKLDLVQEGKAAPDADLVTWWVKTKERMALALRLKRADCYTALLRVTGLRIAYSDGRYAAHVVFPQSLKVAADPDAPMDLDRAYGVAIEIASEGGVRGDGPRRWEFWSAREGKDETPLHLILEVDGDAARVIQRDEGDPLRRADDKAMVPVVLFSAHTEELGLFATEGKGLVPANLGLNVLVTDIHHIAEQQGFGVMVITSPAGEDAPTKIVRAPNTAIALRGGVTASFINPNAPLAELVQLADTRIKQAAVFRGLPAGAVSIEARAVASGIALQIEMRPLLEQRQDAIEVYREPMRRIWEVVRATHNAYLSTEDDGLDVEIPPEVSIRWTPGDVQMPTDDQVRIDNALAKMKARLQSRIETIAELRGISLDEAREVAARIDEEEPASATDPLGADLLGLGDKKQQLKGGAPADPAPAPAAPPADPAAAAPGSKAAQVDALAVDPTTALNGAQVQALVDVIAKVVTGELPRASGIEIIVASFPVTRAQAEAIMGEVGKGFVPAPPEPKGGPTPPTPPTDQTPEPPAPPPPPGA